MRSSRALRHCAVASCMIVGVLLAGCSVATVPSTAPTQSEVLPVPGRTVEATVPSTQDLRGYRIAVVVPDDSTASQSLLEGMRRFAQTSEARLEEFSAVTGHADPVGRAFDDALSSGPDLLVGIGDGVTEVFNYETPKHLSQQMLVVGAQLFEPTENVTAVIWDDPPAGEGGAGADASASAQERGAQALGAGVLSVREGVTGVVLHLEEDGAF